MWTGASCRCLTGYCLILMSPTLRAGGQLLQGSLGPGLGAPRISMTITLICLVVLLVIAGVCGSIGRAIGGGTVGGFFVSIAVGFVGALLGTFLAHRLSMPDVLVIDIDRHPFPILWSIIG